MEIDAQTKTLLLEERLRLWRNTLFAHETDAKLAQKFVELNLANGEQMLEAAKAEMKRCIVAIEALQAMLDEIKQPAQ